MYIVYLFVFCNFLPVSLVEIYFNAKFTAEKLSKEILMCDVVKSLKKTSWIFGCQRLFLVRLFSFLETSRTVKKAWPMENEEWKLNERKKCLSKIRAKMNWQMTNRNLKPPRYWVKPLVFSL